jgi:8-oxo-dGTP pyrophosphatase MutT (NUDIX family)
MSAAWKPPSVTVAAVIEQAGRFLMVEEIYEGARVLNQPAGHLDPGESLVHACTREVMEETAHRFTPESLVGIYRLYYAPRDITFLRFSFAGRLDGVEPGRALDKEIVAAHWYTRNELVDRSCRPPGRCGAGPRARQGNRRSALVHPGRARGSLANAPHAAGHGLHRRLPRRQALSARRVLQRIFVNRGR